MYVPLKVVTDYSILKSLIKIKDLITFLNDKKINACGICDENLYGVLEFYNACLSNNIKPIVGLNIKIDNLDIYLYAMNYKGYQNLLKIHTIKETRELNISDLEEYQESILVIIPYSSITLYKSLSFYEHLYLGYSNTFEHNNALILSNNVVYVRDLRVLNKEDTKYLKYLDMLRKDDISINENCYYEPVSDIGCLDEIVGLINLEIPKNNRYIPKYLDEYSDAFLEKLAIVGLNKRLNGKVSDVYKNRLKYEISVIKNMGFVDYFLIVYDYVLYAKKNNIMVGPGRGSAAGSLVSFAIGITDIDPIKYNLLFERFLNPSRVTMPDIDIDFDATKRDLVIDYVRSKYGEKRVALGLTFNTLKSKLVIREVGKLLKIDSDLVDKFAKVINASMNLNANLNNELVKKYLHNYPELRNVYNISLKLEGLKKNTSTHAAGVIISNVDIDEVIPIHMSNNTMLTGVTMEYLENIGLLKMDFLGLKNLTTIASIIKLIGKNVLKDIDLEKSEVYKMLSSGKTDGIFQLETPAMHDLALKLKPNSFKDLVALIALGRPGPKDQANSYIKRKEGIESVTYLHPDLEPILKETYGIIIYQEQIIAILTKFAGYTLADADIVRRAISKKKEDVLKDEREKFISSSIKRGYKSEVAEEIYNLIVKFASYGFNKSHSVAYARVAYELAYLKCFYPMYFIVEELNNSVDATKNTYYFTYLKSGGVKLYKPSINNIYDNYYIDESMLIMPLWVIKNINKDIAKKIIENRGNGYSDVFDFAIKNKEFLTSALMEILIRAGALDEFNVTHQTLINALDNIFNYMSLASDDYTPEKPILTEYPEYSKDILMTDEENSYGFYITNHPASKYVGSKYMKMASINKYLFKNVTCVVLVDKIRKIKTKNNEDMAFFVGSDETGFNDFTVFPNVYPEFKEIKEKDLILISGKVTKRFDKCQIIVNNIKRSR